MKVKNKLNGVILPILVLFIVVPSTAFASWWNPFSWNWGDFMSNLFGLDTSNSQPVVITTDGLCPEMVTEMDYVNKTYHSFEKEYSVIATDFSNNWDKILKENNDFRDNIKRETRELKYFSQDDWTRFKKYYSDMTIMIDERINKLKLIKPQYTAGEEAIQEQIDDLGLKIFNYRQKAQDIYWNMSTEEYTKVYNDCANKQVKE